MSINSFRNAARSRLKTLWVCLRTAGLLSCDSLFLLIARKSDKPVTGTSPALLIRLDYIGDFLLWLPSARSMSRELRRSGRKVVFVCNPVVEKLALRERIFDEVIPLDREKFGSSPAYRQKFLQWIRNRQWSISVNPTFSREPLFADSVIRFAHAKRAVGFCGDNANTQNWALDFSGRWYDELIGQAPLHDLSKNEAILRQVCGPEATSDYSSSAQDESALSRFHLPEAFAVIFPGASWEGKKWPLERFIEVGVHFQKSRGLHVVLLGALNEKADSAFIADRLDPSLVLNLSGETSVTELVDILAKAKLLISNDTSAVHAAALARVPCVTIVGGGHFGRFLPYPAGNSGFFAAPSVAHRQMACYGCAWNCIYPRQPGAAVVCVNEIPARLAIELASAALSGKTGEIRSC